MATEVSALLAEGIARLQRVADQPRLEAEILLGAALGRSRAWLLSHADERILDCDATDRYEAYVTRRAHAEPIAYILFIAGAMAALARLRAPVDAFFDGVMVNADDARLRANRIALLARLAGAMNRVADLSKLAA